VPLGERQSPDRRPDFLKERVAPSLLHVHFRPRVHHREGKVHQIQRAQNRPRGSTAQAAAQLL